jgi:hypothetical protein
VGDHRVGRIGEGLVILQVLQVVDELQEVLLERFGLKSSSEFFTFSGSKVFSST